MNLATAVLGDEFDDALKEKVFHALIEIGATRKNFEYLHGGSQDVYIWTYQINEKLVIIEAETYIGLSIKAEQSIIDRVRELASRL